MRIFRYICSHMLALCLIHFQTYCSATPNGSRCKNRVIAPHLALTVAKWEKCTPRQCNGTRQLVKGWDCWAMFLLNRVCSEQTRCHVQKKHTRFYIRTIHFDHFQPECFTFFYLLLKAFLNVSDNDLQVLANT